MNNTTLLRSFVRPFAFGLTLMLGMTATVLAQSTSGTLRGTVVDPTGALIPHAQVTISNTAGFTRTLISGATGAYTVANLAPGSYSVSIDATGFTPTLEGGVQVMGNKVTRETVKLGISVNQEIEVSANDDVAPAAPVTSGDTSAR